MNSIGDYFKDTDKLAFLELKDSSYKGLSPDISYPLLTKSLLNGIKDGQLEEEVSYEDIIEGIVVVIAMDPAFIYKDEYMESLSLIIDEPASYIARKAGQYLDDGDMEMAGYYYRFLYITNMADSISSYSYARILYDVYLDNQDLAFKNQASEILYELVDTDPEFPLSYYLLAIISSADGLYSKSYLYLTKAEGRVTDSLAREEVRDMMRQIKPYALMERGMEKLYRADIAGALEDLEEAKNMEDSGEVNYYIGVAHEAGGDLDLAIDHYERALDLGFSPKDLYQDLAIAYYKKDQPGEALELLNLGLEKYKEDSSLLYNRMVIYISLGRMDLAKADKETILEYGDVPEEILENIRIIQQEYGI